MQFIHAADLHIDSPLQGLDAYPGAPVDRLRAATRQALIGLVDLALERAVDLVLLAGDIYDGDWVDFRTGLFFREQMQRLRRAGIRVFIVKGNHDAASQITRQLPAIEGVTEFSSRGAETIDLPELGVAVHGRSFPNRSVNEDLVPGYPAPVVGRFNIGMLHTSLTGRPGHDDYAPTTVDTLISRGYDYFALGHVHNREVVREAAPRIVFPGNLQGRHARETGPKGCELVTVEDQTLVSTEFIALDTVRWHVLRIDADGIGTIDALAMAFVELARQLSAEAPERLHAMRVHLQGESALHALEAATPGTLAASIHAAALDLDGIDLWIEQVRLELRSPLDRMALVARPDALGEVLRLADEIGADDATLKDWVMTRLGQMPALPASLADADHRVLPVDVLRDLLADAEATVLARLADASEAKAR